MEQEQLTLYKLMILYLIEKVDFPLSNSQISEFILDKGYTNYFTVQRAFHELEEENMLRVKQIRNMSHYALSDEGSEAIEMFENEEIGLNACKKIIMACKNGVYWCDGNEDEAIACIIDCYCGNCLRRLHQEHRIRVDRNRYDVVTHYLCEDCYQHLVYEESILKKHVYVEKTS